MGAYALIKLAKRFPRIRSRRVGHEAVVDCFEEVCKLTNETGSDTKKPFSCFTAFFTTVTIPKERIAGLDFRQLTFICEFDLAQPCDVDVIPVEFSSVKCCPSLRTVCFSAVHERTNIPCADSERCHFCFHFDI